MKIEYLTWKPWRWRLGWQLCPPYSAFVWWLDFGPVCIFKEKAGRS